MAPHTVLHWLYGSLNYDFARYENYVPFAM